MSLTGKQRHHLRSLAHHLDPVVQIGHDGVTGPVISQIDVALAAHELIKVRLSAECPTSRDETAEIIAAGTHAEIAQIIGRIIVVWRRRAKNVKKAKIALKPGGAQGQKGSKGRPPGVRARAAARTAAVRANKRKKTTAGKARRRAVKGPPPKVV